MISASRANTPVEFVYSSAVLYEVRSLVCVFMRVCSTTGPLSFSVSKPFGSTEGDGATSSKLSFRYGGPLIFRFNLGEVYLSSFVVTVSNWSLSVGL